MADKIELPGKIYLGDSVYCEVDRAGYYILTTENGLPTDPSNRIILEPGVFDTLADYVVLVRAAILKWREAKIEMVDCEEEGRDGEKKDGG